MAQPGEPLTGLTAAVPWLCGRHVRDFRATATLAGGRFVRGGATALTPACAHRFTLTAPRRARRGRRARVVVTDTWGIGGIRTRLCTTEPAGRRGCRRLAFPAAVSHRSLRLRPARRGTYRLDLQVRRFHARAAIAVGVNPVPSRRRPLLLATGDSTMNGVDSALGDDLGEFDVRSAVFPGAEISNIAWLKVARAQTASLHPAVTVVSIGAIEGFPITSPDGVAHDCCGAPWVAEYTRRVRAMIETYRQGGRARVYVETIPLSREAARAAIVRVCNQAIVAAAQGLAGVSVLRMDLLFTPHGYQETVRDGGRDVPVREDDGIHLNASGTSIEARETAKAIRGEPNEIPSELQSRLQLG